MDYPSEIKAFVQYYTVTLHRGERTAREYARDILRLARFVSPVPVVDATTEQIQAFLDHLQLEGRNKPQSVRRKYAAIAAFFKYLKKKKLIDRENPCGDEAVELPKCAKPLPKVMSEDEVTALLQVRLRHRRHERFQQARDRAMMEILYGSGLRRFEVTGLDLLDVDPETRKICVRHGKGDKERYSRLTPVAAQVIREYLEVRSEYVTEHSGTALFITCTGPNCGQRISPRQLWSVFRDHRTDAQEKYGLKKHITPHTMRHSFATHIYRNCRDIRKVQKLLGHSSINTTERYTHIDDEELWETFDASHPRAQLVE